MAWQIPFVRRREPEYNVGSPPTQREQGDEPREFYPGIPDPVRSADFEGVNNRRGAQLFTTVAEYAGFGTGMGIESFGGRRFQPDPSAGIPSGALSVDPPRRVVARPPTRTTR